MQMEMHGSHQLLRKRIERSLLIEQVLKTEVEDKSAVSLDKNPARFEKAESFDFQSISILPPQSRLQTQSARIESAPRRRNARRRQPRAIRSLGCSRKKSQRTISA